MAATNIKFSQDDDVELKQLVDAGELDKMKAFLSAKNISLSDPVLWPEDKHNIPLIATAMSLEEVEITRCLINHYPKTLSIDQHFSIRGSYAGNLLHAAIILSAKSYLKINIEQVKCVLEAGASPNVRDTRGHTSLHVLFHFFTGDSSLLHCLIKYGADVNAVDSAGNTPLHMLLKLNWRDADPSEAIRCLVDHGAYKLIDHPNSEGQRFLHLAVHSKYICSRDCPNSPGV